jgi:predicted ATP-dependent Lon-type protease
MSGEEQKWTTEEEQFLASLERQCNTNYDNAIKEYKYYNKLSSKFNIPILIISALNALCAVALNDFLRQKYVSILNAILSAGTGVLGSIQLYMKINEKMTNALRSSIHLKKIALKISKELTIDRKDRLTNGQGFLSDCFAEFNTAIEQGNPIESKIQNHLKFGDGHMRDEVPSTPLRRVADRFMKVLTPSLPSRNSLDESRREKIFQQLAGANIGSGQSSPV